MEKEMDPVKLTYMGNSCILVSTSNGTRIVSDPYGVQRPPGLSDLPKDLAADAVTVSHVHPDHNNISAVSGNPRIITKPGVFQVGSIQVTGYPGWEGSPHGPNHEMQNVIYAFDINGVKIVQLGDSGIITEPEIINAVENADLVVVNIDGYVIPHEQVIPFMHKIKARTVLLAHYTLDGQEIWCGAPTAEEFITTYAPENHVFRGIHEINVFPGMPGQIAVLKPFTHID